MSRIKSKNTKPEVILRKKLFMQGLRYRINDKKLPGKPDIVLKKHRTAIFVNGCFWHGHDDCRYFTVPKSNIDFWTDKINKNKIRDLKNLLILKEMGWKVITVWECDLKKDKLDNTVKKVIAEIKLSCLQE